MLPRSHASPLISILAHSRIRQHVRALCTSSRCLEEQPLSTVNDAEIAHFSRLSDLWWDERGEFALLHKMNGHRMRFIREKLLLESVFSPPGAAAARVTEPSRVLAGLDALDVGCGGGILSEASPSLSICTRISALADTPARPAVEPCASRRQHARRRRIPGQHPHRVAPCCRGSAPR